MSPSRRNSKGDVPPANVVMSRTLQPYMDGASPKASCTDVNGIAEGGDGLAVSAGLGVTLRDHGVGGRNKSLETKDGLPAFASNMAGKYHEHQTLDSKLDAIGNADMRMTRGTLKHLMSALTHRRQDYLNNSAVQPSPKHSKNRSPKRRHSVDGSLMQHDPRMNQTFTSPSHSNSNSVSHSPVRRTGVLNDAVRRAQQEQALA